MNLILAALMFGAVTVDLATCPTSSTGARAKPTITCTAGETYSTAIDWGDAGPNPYGMQWCWACYPSYHLYSSAGGTWNVTAITKFWDSKGRVLPDVRVTKAVTLPRRLAVTLTPGHGTLTVDIAGGLAPYTCEISHDGTKQTRVVTGSFTLLNVLGGYMVSVMGANSSPDLPGTTWQPEQAGATANVLP